MNGTGGGLVRVGLAGGGVCTPIQIQTATRHGGAWPDGGRVQGARRKGPGQESGRLQRTDRPGQIDGPRPQPRATRAMARSQAGNCWWRNGLEIEIRDFAALSCVRPNRCSAATS